MKRKIAVTVCLRKVLTIYRQPSEAKHRGFESWETLFSRKKRVIKVTIQDPNSE